MSSVTGSRTCRPRAHSCACVVYTCVHVCVRVHVCVHVCMRAYVYVCEYVRVLQRSASSSVLEVTRKRKKNGDQPRAAGGQRRQCGVVRLERRYACRRPQEQH
jgi:hypothetical protein